jgi:hypothetical protein
MLDGMWTALAFAVVGAIHLIPVAPVFVPETLSRLYGIEPGDSVMLVLMRARTIIIHAANASGGRATRSAMAMVRSAPAGLP